MIRKGLLLVCVFAVAPVFGTPDAFDDAEKALATKDYPKAVALLEPALSGEPDSMRLGSEYRQAILKQSIAGHPKEGATADFDKEIAFFEKLVAQHPTAANAYLNFGFSYVDKIPAAGAITQVILANNALGAFTKSIDAHPSWIALYTRGNSYLYWPKIFGRAQLGVNDLEKAYAMQQKDTKKPYHIRVFVSLGDGYWKTDQIEKARAIWEEGLKVFPDSQPLKDRLARQGDELKTYIDGVLDPSKRVDTDLRELWMNP